MRFFVVQGATGCVRGGMRQLTIGRLYIYIISYFPIPILRRGWQSQNPVRVISNTKKVLVKGAVRSRFGAHGQPAILPYNIYYNMVGMPEAPTYHIAFFLIHRL